jgi:hypothetical protein
MKVLWCWRCQMDVPMLDEPEFERVSQLSSGGLHAKGLALKERLRVALEEYQRLTGFAETNFAAMMHHRLFLYGPPCAACGKPLRTPQAQHCAACGAQR